MAFKFSELVTGNITEVPTVVELPQLVADNATEDLPSLCRIFWETQEEQGDYVYEILSMILENEGKQVINGDGPLPRRELADDLFNFQDHTLNNHQELSDSIKEGDFLELNDLCDYENESFIGC